MEQRERGAIGWVRAALTAVIVSVVSIVLLVWGPNLFVTRATRLVHSARVGIATAWFFIVVIAIAFVLRRFQNRGVL